MGFNVKVIIGGFIGFFRKTPSKNLVGFIKKVIMGGFIGFFSEKNPSKKSEFFSMY